MRAIATLTLTGVLAAGIVVSTTALAQDADDEAVDTPVAGVSDEALVDRLIGLERQLPVLPPTNATVLEDETFGTIDGDFTGAAAELQLIEDEARQLFIDADDADGLVADAVASVAVSYVRMYEAYETLRAVDDHDLSRPNGTVDATGVATGADRVAGYLEAGLPLLDLARGEALVGYAILRDSDAADDAEKGLFDAAYRDTERYMFEIRPQVGRVISAPANILLPIQRFDAATGEARAKDVDYVCVPRELYPMDSPAPLESLAILIAGGVELPALSDCPGLRNEQVVTTGFTG